MEKFKTINISKTVDSRARPCCTHGGESNIEDTLHNSDVSFKLNSEGNRGCKLVNYKIKNVRANYPKFWNYKNVKVAKFVIKLLRLHVRGKYVPKSNIFCRKRN